MQSSQEIDGESWSLLVQGARRDNPRDGVTATRLHQAVENGELEVVRDLLRLRPEIVNRDLPGHGERLALHIAVLNRNAAMTRLLMDSGADALRGIWPYRKETQAIVIAAERGYHEIVAIIEEAEARRPTTDTPAPDDGPVTLAVLDGQPEALALLLERGFDPDERRSMPRSDEIITEWGRPLAECTKSGKLEMAEMLLARGADANAWACVWNAYRRRDTAMIDLLARYGGVPNAATPGYLRDTELAARMFAAEAAAGLPKGTVREGKTVAEEVLDPAASAGADAILRMALDRIDWPRDDPRWFPILASPLCFWNHIPWIYSEQWDLDRATYLACFAMVLERCHANVVGRFGMTILHYAAASYNWIRPEERVAFVRKLLEHGARTDVRDELLKSTPLAWACRWGRSEVARLLLDWGADLVEADAEPWATPRAWAEKMGHNAVIDILQEGRER